MSNGTVLVGPCHVYIPKAFRWKGYPSFFAISLNVHADGVGVGMHAGRVADSCFAISLNVHADGVGVGMHAGRVADSWSLLSVGICGVFGNCCITWRRCVHVWQV